MFGDKITHRQHKLDGTTSEVIDVAWQYRESSWMIPFLKGPNRFIGILFEKVLNYDPYHEKWEKRLSKHFLGWLHATASKAKKPGISIAALLQELNLDIDIGNPHRTKERFVQAMDRLMADGLLTWDYKDEVKLPARKWLPTWLQQQIIVDDPPTLKERYLPIKTAATVIRAQDRVQRQNQRKKGAKKTNDQ